MKAFSIASKATWTLQSAAGLEVNSTAINQDGSVVAYGTSSEFDSGIFSFYVYSGDGKQLFAKPISSTPVYQGIFWVAVNALGTVAASGGETGRDKGFLNAYSVPDGRELLNVELKGRANQVSFSDDGTYLLTTFTQYTDGTAGKSTEAGVLQLYTLDQDKQQYQLTDSYTLPGYDFNSCEISANGARAVVSGIIYNKTGTAGRVLAFNVDNGKLALFSDCQTDVGAMRVAVVEDASYWGASLHNGSCVLLSDSAQDVNTPLWQYQPTGLDLSLAYGFDITKTTQGQIVLAVGVNLHIDAPSPDQPLGKLYVVESVAQQGHESPQQQLLADIQYSPNPGVSLDREANYVTATDGKPVNEHTGGKTPESPGNFYLFDLNTSTLAWQHPTKIMNWPMQVCRWGNACIGGSDTGEVLYWGEAVEPC